MPNTPTAQRAATRQRDSGTRALAKKLAWFLAQSPHPNQIRVTPVDRVCGADVLRERMETHDGTGKIGRATLTAGVNRGWFKRTRKSQKLGMVYMLTGKGRKALECG